MQIYRPLARLIAPAFISVMVVGIIACSPNNPQPETGAVTPVSSERFIGDWGGDLKTPVATLALIIHVHEKSGALVSTLDSPDQGAFGIKAKSTMIEGEVLIVRIPAIGARLELHPENDNTLSGKFHQGVAMDITMTRIDAGQSPTPKVRPQTPTPPFPYKTEEVVVKSDNAVLAGTLTIPAGAGPFPTVIMLTGSGPQDRDESIMGHKPFAVLADVLARSGIASLRMDDRGIANSTGGFAQATEQAFATDARFMRAFLANRSDILQDMVGYLGHSEGGIIAPMATVGASNIAFLVLIAGPALPLGDVILDQIKTFTPNQTGLKTALAIQHKIYTALRSDDPQEVLVGRIQKIMMAAGMDESAALAQANSAASPWMRDALDRDAGALIKELSVPVLALYGARDTQVPAKRHAPLMREALQNGNKNSAVVVLEGLNHLMQPAKTGMPDEYGDIETTIDPKALSLITNWIKDQAEG